MKRTCERSVFPVEEFPEKIEEPRPNIDAFKIESFNKLNWSTLGAMIAKLYDYLSEHDNGSALDAMFHSKDFLLEEIITESEQTEIKEETFTSIEMEPPEPPEPAKSENDNETENDIQMDDKQENSNSDSTKCIVLNADAGNSADGSTEDSDAQTTGEPGEDGTKMAAKPKSRRRGSDLKLLDPWFYWKNRKYSQRQKNKQIERMETDTTINGLLRKALEKYFE